MEFVQRVNNDANYGRNGIDHCQVNENRTLEHRRELPFMRCGSNGVWFSEAQFEYFEWK